MLLDHERILADVAACLPRATTGTEACQAAASALGRHTPAAITVLLQVHDRLRCVAATGAWHVFASVASGTGLAGRVYSSGKTETVTDVHHGPDHLPLRPDATVTICTPIVDGGGRPLGVLNLEWASPVDPAAWRTTAERIATRLGARLGHLGGQPTESRSEKLLRHVTALTDPCSEWDLVATVTDAARDVSGLSAAVLVLDNVRGRPIDQPTAVPDAPGARLRARLADAEPDTLGRLVGLAHRYGACYTLGERGHCPADGYDLSVAAGAGTLIAVPVGPPDTGGVLLVADEEVLRPDPTTVNLMELLATQAWLCLDRLRTLQKLHEQASSDPLTGLRHHGPFGERIAAATPGRTALLAIDIDDFKTVNDTYGHQVGDQVLVDLARALEAALRHGDELFRVGGDEFVAVVEVMRPEEAMGIAQRLATAARQTGKTISIGVALQCDGESAELTRRRADTALYQVKRDGRDGVRLARPCPAQRTGR